MKNVEPAITAAEAPGLQVEGIIGRLASFGAWSIFAQVISSGSVFFVAVVIARVLGPSLFGRYSYYLWIFRLVSYVLALGLPATITKVVSEHLGAGSESRARGAFRFALKMQFALLIPGGLVTAWLVFGIDRHVLLAAGIGVGVIFVVLYMNLEGLLSGLRRFKALSLVAAIVAIVQLVVTFVGVAMGVSWETFVLLQIGGVGIGLFTSALVSRPDRRGPVEPVEDRSKFFRLVVVFAFATSLDAIIWGKPELYFLERYRSNFELGLYSAAIRISGIVGVIPLVAARALMPEFSWLRGGGHDEALRSAFPRICRIFALVTAPLAFGGAWVAGPVITMVFGDKFTEAGTATAILLAGSFVNALSGPASASVLTGPRPRLVAEVGIFAAVANIVLAVILIPRFGPVGAAFVNVGVQTLSVIVGMAYARMKLGLRYPLLDVTRIVLIAILGGAGAAAVAGQLGGVVGLAAGIVAGAIIYFATLIATRTSTLEELKFGHGARN